MDPVNQDASKTCGGCKCCHHMVKPIVIILIGVAFLLKGFGVLTWDTVNIIWPILLIIWGVAKFCKCCGHKCGGCEKK